MAFLLLAGPVAASAADQKLILKDGTDQVVRSYEIKSGRVRFFSVERQEWEEIPESLVDWKATEEAKRAAEKPPELDPDLMQPARPPRFAVAPGVNLPESEGVYIYDGKNLLGLVQSQAEIKNDKTRQILGRMAPIPIIKGRAAAELPGSAAKISVAGSSPVLYLQLSNLSTQGYGLVRLKPKDGVRIVGEIAISPVRGNESESQERVPVTTDQVRAEAAGAPAVIRLAPKGPLPPGEYAVVEYVEKGKLNLFVWDFSFRPAAGKSR